MRSAWLFIELMCTHSPLSFSFKQQSQSIFFILTNIHRQAFNVNISLWVILNSNLAAWLLVGGNWRQQIKHEFIVDLQIRDSHSNFLFELVTNLLEDCCNRSGNDSSVLIVESGSRHCERLSSSSLSVAEDRPVEAINHRPNYFSRTDLEYLFLARIVQNLIELKLPGLLLIVNETSILVLGNLQSNCL